MINIAIDGYAGSGKGTLAEGLAKNFSLKHLDTGMILRVMGLYFYNNKIEHPTETDIKNHINNFQISIIFENGVQKMLLDGKDVTSFLKAEYIGQMASRVALYEDAMKKLIEISQEFAKHNDCVLDGRNITSEVLPHADVKIFLDANIDCRALRRYKESLEKGQNFDIDTIKQSLIERDYRDTHRSFSPMLIVPDALVIDNSNLTQEETIVEVSKLVKDKLNKLGKIYHLNLVF